MADLEREYPLGFVDKRRTQSNTTTGLATPANYADTGSLRSRLAAINAGYYTSARLNNMTKNDMIYAVRVNDDAAGV